MFVYAQAMIAGLPPVMIGVCLPSKGEKKVVKGNKSVQGMLSTFFHLIKKYPDDPEHVHIFVNFLRLFIRVKPRQATLPAMELMTVLKREKPTIFSLIKRKGEYDFTLEFLTGLNMDPQQAEENLRQIFAQEPKYSAGS